PRARRARAGHSDDLYHTSSIGNSSMTVVISSGHGKYVPGAVGILNEVDEARRVVDRVAEVLRARGVSVIGYHDDVSRSQSENLQRIVDFHNAQTRDLDVSVHFNCYDGRAQGAECLYLTQDQLAADVAGAISAVGFTNRGAKYRSD